MNPGDAETLCHIQ